VIARAIAKAAAAAAPPISIVWKALRSGAASVKCALTHPKSPEQVVKLGAGQLDQ